MAATILEEGRDAYISGVPQHKCPYNDAARRETWMRGWLERKQEFEAS